MLLMEKNSTYNVNHSGQENNQGISNQLYTR
ncbi:hypothetical protein ABIE50_000727 [Chitinophaga sp. OAE865]